MKNQQQIVKYVKTVFVYCVMLVQMNGAIVPRQKIKVFFCCCRNDVSSLQSSLQSRNHIKKHYVNYHFINDQDIFFKDLFTPDTIDKTCRICNETFKSSRSKEKHVFLFHYRKHQQISGNRGLRTSTLTINILKRGPITYYPINFDQHKKFYDFFSNGIADAFLESVYEIYRPSKENKFQGYAEIINQQRGEIILAGMVKKFI